jgi:hypothetical protein
MNYDWIPWKVFIISITFYHLQKKMDGKGWNSSPNPWQIKMFSMEFLGTENIFFLCWGHMEPVFDMITDSAWNLSKINLCSDSKTKRFWKHIKKNALPSAQKTVKNDTKWNIVLLRFVEVLFSRNTLIHFEYISPVEPFGKTIGKAFWKFYDTRTYNVFWKQIQCVS